MHRAVLCVGRASKSALVHTFEAARASTTMRAANDVAIKQQNASTGYQAARAFPAKDDGNSAKHGVVQSASASLLLWNRARYHCGVTPRRRTKARRKLSIVRKPHFLATAWAGRLVSS